MVATTVYAENRYPIAFVRPLFSATRSEDDQMTVPLRVTHLVG